MSELLSELLSEFLSELQGYGNVKKWRKNSLGVIGAIPRGGPEEARLATTHILLVQQPGNSGCQYS